MTINTLWRIARGEFRGLTVDIEVPVLVRKRPGLVVACEYTSDGFIIVNDRPTEVHSGRIVYAGDPLSHVSRLYPPTKGGTL